MTDEQLLIELRKLRGKEDFYIQLAEEAAELSQAACKMVRHMRGDVTGKTEQEIRDNLIEEYSDVILIARDVLRLRPDPYIQHDKLNRWVSRLEETRNKNSPFNEESE